MDPFCYLYVSCLSCCLVCSLQPCGHLLGKGWPLGSLVCDVFLCFCHFPMWCPGSGVVLDCIDSRSFAFFLTFTLTHSLQSLCCSYTQNMDVDENTDQN